ncbi:response regulator [Hyphobacterium sp. CCMP332]|nr:response regulator [Hyphobacterium sp. CCMP332]
MVKVLIVEDDFIISEELKQRLLGFGYKVLGPVDNTQEAENLIRTESPDVLLLDINLNGKEDGISLAERILASHQVAIIFLTALSDEKTLIRAKKIKPAAYIIKPYEERNLAIAIDVAFSNLSDQKLDNGYLIKDSFFIKDANRFTKIRLVDILFIEAKGSYSIITTENKSYTLTINLKNLLSKFSGSALYRIHRSYVVNIKQIEAFDGHQVIIGKYKLPVANSYKEAFFKRFRFI